MKETEQEELKKKDQKKIELAMQVLRETRGKEEEPEDAYTKMAKKLETTKKKEKRGFALRQATSEQEEEKKGSQSSDSQEVSSESERETVRKLREAAAKLEEN
jgi:hypothetical protein